MDNKAPQKAPPYAMLEQAAEWFAILGDEAVTKQQQAHWQHWLNQTEQHRQAWQYVETIGQRFQQASTMGEQGEVSQTLGVARNNGISRRKALRSLGAVCVAGWLSWRFTPLETIAKEQALAWQTDYQTHTGRSQQITLPDGGKIWLNTATAINTHYTRQQRHIELLRGEILIETASDQQKRPFSVTTAQGKVQAIGTRFTVREQQGSTFLAVYQGAVKIHTLNGNSQIVKAGQQTSFNQQTIQPVTPADHAREAWVKHLLVANNISLDSLINELSRYQYGHLSVDPAIAQIKVIGTYPTNQPEHALVMLEKALPIKVNRLLPWWVTLEAK